MFADLSKVPLEDRANFSLGCWHEGCAEFVPVPEAMWESRSCAPVSCSKHQPE